MNGYSAIFGRAAEIAAINDDLPALGYPTSAISATLFNSSESWAFSPGSPSNANPGARLFEEESAAFPNPPAPPRAAINFVPLPNKSAMSSPSAPRITVPSGTGTIKSSPSGPSLCPPFPNRPDVARR